MRNDVGTIISNEKIALDTYKMVIKSDLGLLMQPGMFVNIKIDNMYLRRPISIAAYDEQQYTIIYKVVGDGTALMAKMQNNQQLDVLGPLGNPFPLTHYEPALLVGGGVGVPPLYQLAKELVIRNVDVEVVLGFRDKDSAFYVEAFEELGCKVYVASDDGSIGIKGNVLDAIKVNQIKNKFLYACGPMVMLRALAACYTQGYMSFEARMACGMGACMGCVCHDHDDQDLYYRICKDGPVLPIGKVDLSC